MKAYIIIFESLKTGFKTVSQEAYFDLAEAQKFCLNRSGNVQQVSSFIFVDEKCAAGYEIKEICITKKESN